MSCNSFEKSNSGQQIGVNNGTITFIHDRPETKQQNVDNDVLRSLAFPHMLDRRDNIELCHANTCQWILELEEYKSWRSQPRGLLWVKGKPGAGKSTLMAFLYNELKKETEICEGSETRLEFFFTARGTELQRTPVGMLRSLLNQIFDYDATIRPQVQEVYMQRCKQFGFGEQQWEWPRGLLENLLAETIIASASRRPLTLFVDALDEAGVGSAQQLAEYFHRVNARAQKDTVPVKICISCRHFPIINPRATEIIVENHNHKDITTYIKDHLLIDRTMESNESDSDLEAWQGLVDDLIHQAKGVFQWAHIVMPIIQRKVQEGNSPSDIRDWLPKVPAGLADVYKYILSDIIDHDNREQSFLFFQWICLAERPLTVTEMRYAMAAKHANIRLGRNQWSNIKSFVGTDNRMKLRIKALSGGLAEITSKKDSRESSNIATNEDSEETVQVVHQSVNDFLREEGLIFLRNIISGSGSSDDNKEIISQCQATVYVSCLIYLATEEVSSKISLDRRDFKEEELSNAFSLLSYATINLFVHAEKAGRSRVGVIADEVSLLQRLTSYWVRAYNQLKYYHSQRDGSPIPCPAPSTTLLQMAAAANMIDIIDGLGANGLTINKRNNKGETALHFAAAKGHISAAEILQARGADCEARNEHEMTPLMEAAGHGRVTFVEWLLRLGVNINKSPGSSETALQTAALENQESILRLLMGAGAEVNAQGGTYGNALQAAAYRGSVEIVRILLDARADVNAQGGVYGNALQTAACNGRVEVFRILLDAGADVNAQGGVFGNALQGAASYGSMEIFRILLDAGADMNAQGGCFGNALQAAAYRGSVEIVRFLLDTRADVNAPGGDYGNALQAGACNGSVEVLRVLLDAGANINAQGGTYGNALQGAVSRRRIEIVRFLLDTRADVNAQGGLYGNALQAAAYGESFEIVRILLDAGADVNAQGGLYGNALQAAACRWSVEIVRILQDAGADVNAQGGYYGNALQAATCRGRVEIVRILLDAGADVNAQGGYYDNALQAAAWNESVEIVRILLDAGVNSNDCGGEYIGDALLASIYQGNCYQVELLLAAGADPSRSDGLNRSPLYIAASRGHLDIIHHFPLLISNINSQDEFLQTPLQVAIMHDHVDFALALLENGADPCLQDGFGRNCLDWAVHNGIMEDDLRRFCPTIASTPYKTQQAIVRQSIHRLSITLLRSTPDNLWPFLEQLGLYLLFLGELNDASFIFQLYRYREDLGCKFYSEINCDNCDRNIGRRRFICRFCTTSFCTGCQNSHSHVSERNEEVEFLHISYVSSNDLLAQESAQEQLDNCLKDLLYRFGDGATLEPGYTKSSSSTATQANTGTKKSAASGTFVSVLTMMTLSKILAYPLLLCMLVGLLASWYLYACRSPVSR